MKNVDELLRRLGARGRSFLLRVDQMLANVALKHLGHQGVDGTARGRDEVENLGALVSRFNSAFNGLDLTTQSSNTAEQLLIVSSVRHPRDISYLGMVWGSIGAELGREPSLLADPLDDLYERAGIDGLPDDEHDSFTQGNLKAARRHDANRDTM